MGAWVSVWGSRRGSHLRTSLGQGIGLHLGFRRDEELGPREAQRVVAVQRGRMLSRGRLGGRHRL